MYTIGACTWYEKLTKNELHCISQEQYKMAENMNWGPV